MPTDDVSPRDAPTPAPGPATDVAAEAPPRATSASELGPDPADAPKRLTRRQLREQREREARERAPRAPEAPAAPDPADETAPAGPFAAFARAGATPAAPSVTVFLREDEPAAVPAAEDGTVADDEADAVPGPGTALLESIEAEFARAADPTDTAAGALLAPDDDPVATAAADTEDEPPQPVTPAGAAATCLPSGSERADPLDEPGTGPSEPEPADAAADVSPLEIATVAMDVAAAIEAERAAEADTTADRIVAPAPSALPAPQPRPVALGWVDPATVAMRTGVIRTAASPQTAEPLLPPRRRRLAPVLAPIATAGVLTVAYVAAAALWPLAEVEPVVNAVTVETAPGPGLDPRWPEDGAAAVAAEGLTETIASSSNEVTSMASITKLVTSLMVLERQPLELGEQGPSYEFTWEDQQAYWGYVNRGESRLEAPSGTVVSQYQLLQGVLIGSANNWATRLVDEVFGSTEEFAAAAPAWLEEHGLTTMTVVEPTGIDRGNAASPADMARLGEIALANPVIAEIVAQREVEIPGVGTVENTNQLIADEGVVGLKTGTFIGSWNLLVAREVEAGEDVVTVIASVVGQPDAEMRDQVSRDLLDDVAASLIPVVTVPAGTTVAQVSTEWGDSADYVTAEDAILVMWNGDVASTTSDVQDALGRAAGEQAGSLTTTGSFSDTTVAIELTDDVGTPGLWWRLTHPLDLLGLR